MHWKVLDIVPDSHTIRLEDEYKEERESIICQKILFHYWYLSSVGGKITTFSFYVPFQHVKEEMESRATKNTKNRKEQYYDSSSSNFHSSFSR